MLFHQILYFTVDVDASGLFPDWSSFQQIDDERQSSLHEFCAMHFNATGFQENDAHK